MRFWETKEWLNYLLNSKIEVEIIDHSFYLDGKFVSLVQEGQEFYSYGFDDDKNILQHIKELALQHDIKRIQVNSQIKSYLNISGYTCVINPFEINPTKGCKSAIKKGQKYLSYITDYDIYRFKADYFRIAGKQTRPDKTFDILEEWRNKGYGTLITALMGRIVVGHTYILHYGNWSYYFMSCVELECREYNVSHYLQTIAFEILKNKGITHYELGEQVYNNLVHQPTDKELNISLFKRSFGGEIVLNPVSEYFFDERFYRETMLKRINGYWEREHEENIIVFP